MHGMGLRISNDLASPERCLVPKEGQLLPQPFPSRTSALRLSARRGPSPGPLSDLHGMPCHGLLLHGVPPWPAGDRARESLGDVFSLLRRVEKARALGFCENSAQLIPSHASISVPHLRLPSPGALPDPTSLPFHLPHPASLPRTSSQYLHLPLAADR